PTLSKMNFCPSSRRQSSQRADSPTAGSGSPHFSQSVELLTFLCQRSEEKMSSRRFTSKEYPEPLVTIHLPSGLNRTRLIPVVGSSSEVDIIFPVATSKMDNAGFGRSTRTAIHFPSCEIDWACFAPTGSLLFILPKKQSHTTILFKSS